MIRCDNVANQDSVSLSGQKVSLAHRYDPLRSKENPENNSLFCGLFKSNT